MDWPQYKRLCDRPDVVSRWLIEQTLELVADRHLEQVLDDVLRAAPLQKPVDHRGGAMTDMFVAGIPEAQVRAIAAAVARAAEAGRKTQGTAGRGFGGIVAAWSEYARHSACHDDG